jgi:enamine deaminase RidA (YjgF/YER057c/UK114 family)
MAYQLINPDTLSKSPGYSHVAVVEAGKQLHVSGQVAFDAAGQLVGKGDLGAQAEQVFSNLGLALTAAGSSLSRVFKLVTYVVDLTPEKAAAIRAVRSRHLGAAPYPASTMVGVTSLVFPELLIEIEAIADVG